jgi:hypothetical protein
MTGLGIFRQARLCPSGSKAFAIPAMKIGMMPIICALALLTGCGVADRFASFLRKDDPQPTAVPPRQSAPEPNVKELIRVGANTLFTAPPTAVSVSRPHRIIPGTAFSVCVKAMVAGPLNPEPQLITLFVMIENGRLAGRHRALPEDGCATDTYEKVEVAR